MLTINSIEALEALYGLPKERDLIKEVDHITPNYRKLIEASPFMVVATGGPEGMDCSPRGDEPGFVRVVDEKTLMFPDRPGNNRADSLRNIIRNPYIALLFMIPGIGVTLRINGRAQISIDENLLQSFAIAKNLPKSVVVITAESVYFQCSRAIVRANLWDPDSFPELGQIPTAGELLTELSDNKFSGEKYDLDWANRPKMNLR
ncbi:MAG: PPOX class probable FMN-dependent enzyme [Gammaproteobacteria bacterium]|jgi:PPOX class probable FMN-dependent enzyme